MRASERVERTSARSAPASTIRTQVANRTPARAASGMPETSGAATKTRASSDQRVGDRGQPGGGSGAHVDRGPGDRGRGGDAAEQRHDDVRQPLPEQLPVGVVVLVDGHRVGDRRAQQALQRGERGDRPGPRWPACRRRRGRRRPGRARAGSGGRWPRVTRSQVDDAAPATVATATPIEGVRHPRAPARAEQHQRRHAEGDERAGRGAAARRTGVRRPPRLAQTLSPEASVTPSAAGTCCRAMTTAMPAVKPSMTETGR